MIFSTVTTFVEQVGRRQVWKYSELDNMVCIWTGPASGALQFKPKINSSHPQYPLMFVTDSEIATKEGAVAEVSVTYAGIIQTNGAKSYRTPPIISVSAVQGSRDFHDIFISPHGPVQWVYAGVAGVNAVQFYDVTPRPVTVRYIGSQCSIRYQAYPRPSRLVYSGLGLSLVGWEIMSSTYGPSSTVVAQVTGDDASKVTDINYEIKQGQLPSKNPTLGVQPLYAANLGFSYEQRGQWYDCTEIYGPTF